MRKRRIRIRMRMRRRRRRSEYRLQEYNLREGMICISPCFTMFIGWINSFLSWSLWIPLGRLTYSAYLIHGLVVLTYYMGYPTAVYFSIMSSVSIGYKHSKFKAEFILETKP